MKLLPFVLCACAVALCVAAEPSAAEGRPQDASLQHTYERPSWEPHASKYVSEGRAGPTGPQGPQGAAGAVGAEGAVGPPGGCVPGTTVVGNTSTLTVREALNQGGVFATCSGAASYQTGGGCQAQCFYNFGINQPSWVILPTFTITRQAWSAGGPGDAAGTICEVDYSDQQLPNAPLNNNYADMVDTQGWTECNIIATAVCCQPLLARQTDAKNGRRTWMGPPKVKGHSEH